MLLLTITNNWFFKLVTFIRGFIHFPLCNVSIITVLVYLKHRNIFRPGSQNNTYWLFCDVKTIECLKRRLGLCGKADWVVKFFQKNFECPLSRAPSLEDFKTWGPKLGLGDPKTTLTLRILVSLLGFWVSKLILLTNSNRWMACFCYCSDNNKTSPFPLLRGWIYYLVNTCGISVLNNSISCLEIDVIFLTSLWSAWKNLSGQTT